MDQMCIYTLQVYGGIPTACHLPNQDPTVGKVIKDVDNKWYDGKYLNHTMNGLNCYPVYMQVYTNKPMLDTHRLSMCGTWCRFCFFCLSQPCSEYESVRTYTWHLKKNGCRCVLWVTSESGRLVDARDCMSTAALPCLFACVLACSRYIPLCHAWMPTWLIAPVGFYS